MTVSSKPSSSSSAETVTVRAVFHVAALNVTAPCAPATASSASTVAALASLLAIATVTGPVGCVDSATVYVPLSFSSRPASVEVATRTTRRGSSSVTATDSVADTPPP